MNSLKPVFAGCFLVLALAFGTINARAQDEPQEPSDTKPKPAARSIPPIDAGNTQDENPNALQPDTTPLTGVQNATLGSPEVRHSYWVPGVQYAGTIQSNGYGTSEFFRLDHEQLSDRECWFTQSMESIPTSRQFDSFPRSVGASFPQAVRLGTAPTNSWLSLKLFSGAVGQCKS